MFTQSDLSDLVSSGSAHAVSMFLPTQTHGREVRQRRIRVKNLLGTARSKLSSAGLGDHDVDRLVAGATALVDDDDFWQHPDAGLAIFFDENGARSFTVPLPLDEQVIVGSDFELRPLLPLLATDGRFAILTVTADETKMFRASRHSITEDTSLSFPAGPAKAHGDSDYENPVQASPSNRPNVGTANISNAQVYGDSPPEFREARLRAYVEEVAAAVEGCLASDGTPLVIVADADIAGMLRNSPRLHRCLAGTVDVNPTSLDAAALRKAAFEVVAKRFAAHQDDLLDRVAVHLGHDDGSATSALPDVVRGAHHARVDTLLIAEGYSVRGHYDPDADRVESGDAFEDSGTDLAAGAVIDVLRHGGNVCVVPPEQVPQGAGMAALLRF